MNRQTYSLMTVTQSHWDPCVFIGRARAAEGLEVMQR